MTNLSRRAFTFPLPAVSAAVAAALPPHTAFALGQAAHAKTLPPAAQFKVGRFYRDRDKGTGAIVLNVPGPGTVTLESKKLKYQVNVAAKAKDIGLSVLAAPGRPKQKLLNRGKLKAKVKLTFIPDGGSPSSQKQKLKLIYNG